LDRSERILYIEQWDEWNSLRAHMKSGPYAHLLQILELSKDRPEVEFREVTEAHGLEFVEAVRLGRAQRGAGRSSCPLSIAEIDNPSTDCVEGETHVCCNCRASE
jgi:hypothetical protein